MQSIILQIVPQNLRVSSKITEKLSDIFIGVGHLMLGSIVIPYLVDKFDPRFILIGVASALVSWGISIWLVSK